MEYSTQLGRSLLWARHSPLDLTTTRWKFFLSPHFNFEWNEVWDGERARKEECFYGSCGIRQSR
jgi:hypothetical protein